MDRCRSSRCLSGSMQLNGGKGFERHVRLRLERNVVRFRFERHARFERHVGFRFVRRHDWFVIEHNRIRRNDEWRGYDTDLSERQSVERRRGTEFWQFRCNRHVG